VFVQQGADGGRGGFKRKVRASYQGALRREDNKGDLDKNQMNWILRSLGKEGKDEERNRGKVPMNARLQQRFNRLNDGEG